MKKALSIFCLVFIFTSVSSQNYETIKPEISAHFGNIIHSIEIDSITYSGDSTFFFNFQMIREGSGECDFVFGASWTGQKIIALSNGYNLFVNKNLDTIFINTQAVLNEKWTLFTYPDNNYIEAEVTNHDIETFFGLSDSVKTITLQLKAEDGTNISNEINDKYLKISKNYGFVIIFNFYEFPFDEEYSDWLYFLEEEMDLIGIGEYGYQNYGAKEIYDYQVGDIVHIFESSSSIGPDGYWSETKTILKVIDKDSSGNIVTYTYNRCARNESIDYYSNTSDTTFTHDTIQQTFNFTSNNLLELSQVSYNPYEEVEYWWSFLSCTQSYKVFGDAEFSENPENCLSMIIFDKSEPKNLGYKYLKGLGGPYYYNTGIDCTCERRLVYYKKSSTTWGTPYSCDVLSYSQDILANEEIGIYPIPAKNSITIELNVANNSKHSLKIINISGQVVFQSQIFPQEQNSIDVSNFPTGIYFVKISNEDNQYLNKIIIE